MNGRIFPTKQNEKLERSSVVKTIGIETLSKEMDKMADVKKDMTKTASVSEPVARKKKRYAMRPTMCDSCGVEHPCSCDIIAAQAAGDQEKVASMMEARANRRMAHIQEIEQNVAVEGLNTRTAFRNQLLDQLQKFAADDDGEDDEEPDTEACGNVFGKCEKCGEKECKCPPCKDCKAKPCKCDKKAGFEAVNEISASKKAYFARYAEVMGWPVEYVEAITATSAKSASIPEATKLVLSNKNIAKDNKKQLIVAMHKESKLEPEQANRIKTYWKQELSYPDTEWVDDLVEEPTGK